MFQNKKFGRYAVALNILGIFLIFFYSGFQTEHLNSLTNFLPETNTWSESVLMMPNTVGGIVSVALYLICGIAFLKIGVRKILVPCSIVLSVFAIVLPNMALQGHYVGYFICLLMVRCLVVPMQMGAFMLVSNWFIKYRGRVLGIVTIGSPLFSVVGVQFMNRMAANGQLAASYLVMGGICIVISVLCALMLKDTPEEAGLYPDGMSHAPTSEEGDTDDVDVSLREVVTSKVGWCLIISYGIMQFVTIAMMSFMTSRYIVLGGEELWLNKGLWWLSVGAVLGIPVSYLLGLIDDKFGSIKGSIVLNLLFFLAVVPLAIMPQGGNVGLMIVWAFGVACITGGTPTMHPCVVTYAYGRKRYQGANKWIMPIQGLIMAFAPQYMSFFFDRGQSAAAYYGMIPMLLVSLVAILLMWKVPDANQADRDYGKKKETVDI